MKQEKNLFLWILEQMGYGKLEVCVNSISSLLADLKTRQETIKSNTFYSPEDYVEILNAVMEYEPNLHDAEIKSYSKQMEDTSTKHHFANKLENQICSLEKVENILRKLQEQIVREFIDEHGKDIEQAMSDFSNHGEIFQFVKENIRKVNLLVHCDLKGYFNSSPHL